MEQSTDYRCYSDEELEVRKIQIQPNTIDVEQSTNYKCYSDEELEVRKIQIQARNTIDVE